MNETTRRGFLAAASTIALAKADTTAKLPIRKAVLYSMLPEELSIADRFQLAHDCGFEAIECGTVDDARVADQFLAASKKTNLPIHSVMNRDHWKFPLSSPNPEIAAKSVAGMKTSLQNAHLWGADTVLLVPAVVSPETSYREAWQRSQRQIRQLIPFAKEQKVVIAVEEVWNKFLLSPLEFAHYIDEFKSPWVKSYFDVGNVVLTGYPQDWIRTLGKRIVKLHLKDFSFREDPAIGKRVASWKMLEEGDIDWKAVHDALAEIGYHGTATVELAGGDRPYLEDVSRRVDRIFARA